MRIIYLADIHGAFERVRQLLDSTHADVYIIAGDLIDLPFYSMNTAMHYHDLQTYFHAYRRQIDGADSLLDDFVDKLMEEPDIPEDVQEKGARFQQYTIRARRVMQQKYKVLENILTLKTEASCFCLPGNYDMDLRYTSLHRRDLHLRCFQAGAVRIGGYGGTSGWTQGIPERYVIRCRPESACSERDKEMVSFFVEARPDIIVTHQPAHGFHDHVTPMGPTGSSALLSYCESNEVIACLTGHIHEQWGFAEDEGTVYLNPSNFGDVSQISGRIAEGGFFHEIEIGNGAIQRVTYRKTTDRAVQDIVVYERNDDEWTSRVLDQERFGAHLRGHAYDSQADADEDKVSGLSDVVEKFYPYQQTHCDDKAYKELTDKMNKGETPPLAFDIIGSAGEDLSGQKGDKLDIVVYIRCGDSDEDKLCFKGPATDCRRLASAEAVINERIGKLLPFRVIDCIDLQHVEKSILAKNYECEMLQRFVVYRSVGSTINSGFIAATEELLNRSGEFIRELEGSIRTYFRIFMTAAGHAHSLDGYESHLNAMGIRLPRAMRGRIRAYLERQIR